MGSLIAKAVDAGVIDAELTGIAELERARAEAVVAALGGNVAIGAIADLAESADLLVEAAGAGAVAEVLGEASAHGRDALVLSVGGLLDLDDQIESMRQADLRIYCPSGAIGGLDAVKAAAVGTIESARITTRKPPAGLAGARYLEEHGIDLSSLTGPQTVFEGTARDACRAFPANVNVSAALSLAGIGADRTRVRLVADPSVSRNVHEIEVKGDFGVIRTVTESTPSENPKTSRLAASSAIALLKNMTASLRIGT